MKSAETQSGCCIFPHRSRSAGIPCQKPFALYSETMIESAPIEPALAPAARLDSVSKLYGTFAALRKVTVDFAVGSSTVILGTMARANRRCCARSPA
jgi:hypothetical protein